MLEEGPRKNWFGDDAIVICAWISGICGFLFIVHALTAKDPIVDLRALVVRNFGIGSLLSFVTGIGIFVTVFLTPLFLAQVRAFSSLQIGMALLSVGAFQLIALCAYAFAARYFSLRALLVFGLICFSRLLPVHADHARLGLARTAAAAGCAASASSSACRRS